MKKYEGLFVFEGSRTDEEVEAAVEHACGEIDRLGGGIIKRDMLGKRSFARPMQKIENGHYVRVTFELAPENVDTLLARYKLTGEIFRIQITCAPAGDIPLTKDAVAEAGDGKE